MKFRLSFLFLVFIPSVSFSQITFQRSYDMGTGESAYTVVQTFDGGYAICGRKNLSPSPGAFLLRTNGYGDTLWSKTFPDYIINAERIMRQTSDSGFIICGNDNAIFLVKTDKNGDTLWTSHLPGKVATGIAQTADHGYIVVSPWPSPNLIKTDGSGNLLWQKTYQVYGIQNYGAVYSMLQASDGGYVISGLCDYNAYEHATLSAFLLKTNADGDSSWTRKYSTPNGKVDIYSVCQADGNGYFLAGCMVPAAGTSYSQGYLIRTNATGDTLWSSRNHYQQSCFISTDNTADHNIIAAGVMQTPYGGGGQAIMLSKYKQSGDLAFMRSFSIGNYGTSVQATKDHGFVIAGEKDGNIILIKTDSLGKASLNGISDPPNLLNISVYPNPSKGKFRVSWAGNATSLEITDIGGHFIYRKEFSQNPPLSLDIDLSKKAEGTYIILLKTEKDYRSGKIILSLIR